MVSDDSPILKQRLPQGDAPEPTANNRDLAIYIAQMTAEMSAMSRTAGFDLLAYFLDMARIEARIQADRE
jgi:hypothetical protein